MSSEWIGVIHATMPKYMKGASDLTKRKRLLMALLQKKGRYEYNLSGDECKWQVEFSQPQPAAYAGNGLVDFPQHDAHRQLSVDWRGYFLGESMSMKDKEMNKGNEALIKLFSGKQNKLMKAIRNNFCSELYKYGYESGRENCIHGIESFFGTGTTVAADRIGQPSDTYGGLSTALGNQGGSWTNTLATSPNAAVATDWPDGNGDSEYDYLAPKVVNYSSTNWGTGSTQWEDNCWRAISQLITWLTLTGDEDGRPDICVLASNLFQGYKNHEEAIRRINVPHKGANDLGFGGVLNQDGVALQQDFDCPVNVGYMLNTSQITISSLMPDLFYTKGPDEDPRSGYATLWATGFFGNAKYQPKHMGKLAALA
jgi:hypothetical protein